MPNRSSTNRPRDLHQLAAALVGEATDEAAPAPVDDGKDPAAVALGRKGGKVGGPARAAGRSRGRRSRPAGASAAVNPMTADVAARVREYLSRHGPATVATIAVALAQDAERVSEAMTRLLDTQQIVVVRVSQAGEPLYDVATG